MLGEIFAWREDIWAEELRYFGFYLGKFVYLMDAYEDFETDKRKNAYNVFRYARLISSSVAPGAMPSTLYGSILLTPS